MFVPQRAVPDIVYVVKGFPAGTIRTKPASGAKIPENMAVQLVLYGWREPSLARISL